MSTRQYRCQTYTQIGNCCACPNKNFMSFAISVEKLITRVKVALERKHDKPLKELGIEIPCISTVALQFAPPSPNVASAARYTGDIYIIACSCYRCCVDML